MFEEMVRPNAVFDNSFQSTQDGALAMMLLQPPIAFHRCFVDITQSVTAALFLSVLVDQEQMMKSAGLEFLYNFEEIRNRSGLSRKEQTTARNRLKELNLLMEFKKGFPPSITLVINHDLLNQHLMRLANQIQPLFNDNDWS
jgi:hypothetical protein